MMKTVLSIALLAGLALGAAAGDIFVPNPPNSAGCNNYPFNPSYGDWRYQLVIPASMMGGNPALITLVSFQPCKTVTFKATKFEMTMSHITLSKPSQTYAANLPNPLVVMPAGPITWVRTASTWCTLTLTTPFQYNGVDSLTIEVRYQGGSLQGGTSSTDNQTNTPSLNYYRVFSKGSGSYASPTAQSVDPRGALMVRLTYPDVTIVGSGSPRPGATVTLALSSPADGGLPYQVGTSLGTGPTPIGKRTLHLSLDDLLLVTVQGYLPMIFKRYVGYLTASGTGSADIAIPNDPVMVGVRLHSAFLTLKAGEPYNIKSISNTYSFTIQT